MFKLSKIEEIEKKYPVTDNDLIIREPMITHHSVIKPPTSEKAANIIVKMLITEYNNPRKHRNYDKLFHKLMIKYNPLTSFWKVNFGNKLDISMPGDFDGDQLTICNYTPSDELIRNPMINPRRHFLLLKASYRYDAIMVDYAEKLDGGMDHDGHIDIGRVLNGLPKLPNIHPTDDDKPLTISEFYEAVKQCEPLKED